jgi:hypothetical protein
MGTTTTTDRGPGPWKPSDWKAERCAVCGLGGLFLGDSDVCAKCEGDRALCTCCGTRPRAGDLLCAGCERDGHWG